MKKIAALLFQSLSGLTLGLNTRMNCRLKWWKGFNPFQG